MSPHPGRISPNASVAYLAIAIAIFLFIQSKSKLCNCLALIATATAVLISASTILGKALGLASLYQVAGLNQMLPGTAVAICACAIGLWTLIRPAHDIVKNGKAMEHDINRQAAIIITVVAVIGGIGGFAVLRTSFEEAAANNMLATTQTAAASLVGEIEANLWYPQVISERTSVQIAFAGLLHARRRMVAKPFARIAERFFNKQVTGAQFLDPGGNVVHQFGWLVSNASSLRHPLLIAKQHATLIWSNGYVLETRNEILDGKVLLGVLVIQTRLPRFDTAVALLRQASKATDAAICSKSGTMAICAPTRLRPKAFTLRLDADPTTAASTISLALAGESGVLLVRDPAGTNVISAFVPLKNFGLALGVKSDVQALYAPLRARLLQLLVVLTALVVASSIALRSQLRPLVAALAKEQRRTASILENSNDAFVALDANGRITDWNAQATRMFGWSAKEALDRSLGTLIGDLAATAMREAGITQVRQAGTGAAINGRIELQAMHKDGYMVPVELSVKPEQVGEENIAHAFLHDISERKAAQNALLQSDQRVKLIANNLPALVSYIDHDFRYVFTNNQYQKWFNREENFFTGKTVEEVFGATVFSGVRDQIAGALGGADVIFELVNPIPNSPTNMLVHYVPDRDKNDNVIGVIGMVLDLTEQHEAQRRVEASERQLRAVTDNLPVIITYIDADERLRFMNDAFGEWAGVDIVSAIGQPLADVLGGELYNQRCKELQRALAGERVEFDVASNARDGIRYLHTVYVPDAHADGRTRGVFAVSTDVTPLKKIENELRELSRVDTLTGLPNRRQFNERLEEALARTRRGTVSMALTVVVNKDVASIKQLSLILLADS
ncbi:PAS domain-containing protein, partial [Massilia psychrophila]